MATDRLSGDEVSKYEALQTTDPSLQNLGQRRSLSGLNVRTFYGPNKTPAEDGGSETGSEDDSKKDDSKAVRQSPRKKKRMHLETLKLPSPPKRKSKKPATGMGTPPPRQSYTPQGCSTPRLIVPRIDDPQFTHDAQKGKSNKFWSIRPNGHGQIDQK